MAIPETTILMSEASIRYPARLWITSLRILHCDLAAALFECCGAGFALVLMMYIQR